MRGSLSRRGIAVALAALLSAAAIAGAAVVQVGDVRITVLSQVIPYKLPREGVAPIAVFVAGHLENPRGGVPPQLQRMTIKVNRHGLLQSEGLPVCPLRRIAAVTTAQALRNCGDAVIGSGQFWANIIFSGQPPYPTEGRLLVFNGRQNGKPALFAQIFTSHPFNSSFVIPFTIRKIAKGNFGTELTAPLPAALGSWGYLSRIKLTLRRKYSFEGRRLSYFNAGCPAPEGASRTVFSLAEVSFSFADRKPVHVTVSKTCGVKE
jgi:hypothetical protein